MLNNKENFAKRQGWKKVVANLMTAVLIFSNFPTITAHADGTNMIDYIDDSILEIEPDADDTMYYVYLGENPESNLETENSQETEVSGDENSQETETVIDAYENCDFDFIIENDIAVIDQYHEAVSEYITFDESQIPNVVKIHAKDETDRITISNKDGIGVSEQRIVIENAGDIVLDGVSIYGSDLPILDVQCTTKITVTQGGVNQFEMADVGGDTETITGTEHITFAGDGVLTIFYHAQYEDVYVAMADAFAQVSLQAIAEQEIEDDAEEELEEQEEQEETNEDMHAELTPDAVSEVQTQSGDGGANVDQLLGANFDVTITLNNETQLTNMSEAVKDYAKFDSSLNTLYIGLDKTASENIKKVVISNKDGVTASTQYLNLNYVTEVEFQGVHLERATAVSSPMLSVNANSDSTEKVNITLSKGDIKYDLTRGDSDEIPVDNSIYMSSSGTTTSIISNANDITFISSDGATIALFYSMYDTQAAWYRSLSVTGVDAYELGRSADFGGSGYMGIIGANNERYYPYDFMAKDYTYNTTTKVLTLQSDIRFIIKIPSAFSQIVVAEGCHPEIYFYSSQPISYTSQKDQSIIHLQQNAAADILVSNNVTLTSNYSSTAYDLSVITGDGNNAIKFINDPHTSATNTSFKCVTTAQIDDAITITDEDSLLEYEYFYPLDSPFIITMYEVEDLNMVDDFTYESIQPNTGYGHNGYTNRLLVNTANQFKITPITSVSDPTDAPMVTIEVAEGIDANMIFDNMVLCSAKTTFAPILDVSNDGSSARIELIGTNTLYTVNWYSFNAATNNKVEYLMSPILHHKNSSGWDADYTGATDNISFSGTGTLKLYTNEMSDANETDDDGYTFKQSLAGVEGVGRLSFYHLANNTSKLPYTVTYADGEYTTDRILIDENGVFTIRNSDSVTISSKGALKNSPFTIETRDGSTANVTFETLYLYGNYAAGTPDPVVVFKTPTNLKIGSGNSLQIPDVNTQAVPLMEANANVTVTGTGAISTKLPAGVAIIHANGDASVTNNSSITLTEYIYTADEDVQRSGFSISKKSVYTKNSGNWSDWVGSWADILDTPSTDTFAASEHYFTFDDTEHENLLTINTTTPLLVVNRSTNLNAGDKTTHRLAIGSSELTGTADVTIGGVYIYSDEIYTASDAVDPTRPLITINTDVNITILDNTTNILQVPYDPTDTSTQPTIQINNDSHVKVIESASGTLEIYARAKGLTISDAFERANNNNTLIVKEIDIKYTDPTDEPASGDYAFNGERLNIYTSKPLTISNRTLGGVANVYISVQNLPDGEVANITLDNLKLVAGTNTANAILNIASDTILHLKGDSDLSYLNADTTLPVVRIGASTNPEVSLDIYETTDVGGGSLTVTAQDKDVGIKLWTGGSLTLHSGDIIATVGQESSAIGNYDTTAHGTITVKGGSIDAKNYTYSAAIGSRYNSGPIVIEGGEVNVRRFSSSVGATSNLIGSAGGITGDNSHATFDLQNSAIVRCYDPNYSSKYGSTYSYYLDTSYIYNRSNINQWNGILGTVVSNYDSLIANPTNTTNKARYTIFGNTQLNADLVIKPGETAQFYIGNIASDFIGFENGVQDADDTTYYSNLSVGAGHSFTNNGVVVRNAYLYKNPHLDIVPLGSGTVQVALNDTLMPFIPSASDQDGAYRGNSIFDYFTFQENGESLVGKVNILIEGTTTDGVEVSTTNEYKIPAPGAYTITMTGKSNDQGEGMNALVYTGSAFQIITVHAGNIQYATPSYNDFYYKALPYTAAELLEGVSANLGTLKLNSEADVYGTENDPDFKKYVIDTDGDFTNAGGVGVRLESNSVGTQANFTGMKEFDLPILPRSLSDPNILITGIADVELTDDKLPQSAFDNFKVEYLTADDTKVELTQYDYFGADNSDADYKVGYTPPPINNIIGEGVVTITGLREYDSETNTFSGTGNYNNEIKRTYYIRGDLSTTETNRTTNEKIVVAKLVDGVEKLRIGIAGRPLNIENEIVVTFDAGVADSSLGAEKTDVITLVYGQDYTLDYAFVDDQLNVTQLNVMITGKGNYTNVCIMEDVPYEFDSELLRVDESQVYFKPDNTVDVELIPLEARNYENGGYTGYSDLIYERDYTMTLSYDEHNSEIVYVTLKLIINLTDSQGTHTFTDTFELKPTPAGDGTGIDFSQGVIHLVDTVYERPDGVLRMLDDLILEVSDGDDRKTLAKDVDYTITTSDEDDAFNDTIYGVTVTGLGTYLNGGNNSVSFFIETGKTGTGTSNHVGKGIIDEIDIVTIPGLVSTDEGILDEIRTYINLTMHGEATPLFYGEHFEIKDGDLKVQRNTNGMMISDIVEINVTGMGAVEGETKAFEVRLKSSGSLVDTDFLFFKPDRELNLDDIIIYDLNGSGRTLLKGVDYDDLSAFWYDIDGDGVKEFVAVDVHYTSSYASSNNILEDSDGLYTNRYSGIAGEAGRGETIGHGLIYPVDTVYRLPDGTLDPESIVLNKIGSFSASGDYILTSLTYNTDYTIVSLVERTAEEIAKYTHPSGVEYEAPTHTITIRGTSSNPTDAYSGTISFGIVVKNAGEGTGNDFSKGILYEPTTVYARPDALLYFVDDLVLEVNNGKGGRKQLVRGTDYEVLAWSSLTGMVTVLGMNNYTGTTTFKYTTGAAGGTVSTNHLRDGSIYEMILISEDQYSTNTINQAIEAGIADNIRINIGGQEGARKLIEGDEYTLVKIEDISYTTNTVGAEGIAEMLISDDSDVAEVETIVSVRKRVYLEGVGAFANTDTNFIVEMSIDQSRIDISEAEVVQTDGNIIYQRPDGEYSWLDLQLTVSDQYRLEPLTMYYPTDFYFELEDEATGQYTIYGIGNYKGLKENVVITVQNSGNPNSTDFSEGIIDHVLEMQYVLEEGADLNIDLSQLQLSYGGGQYLDSSQYTIKEIEASEMITLPSADLTALFGSGYSYRYVEVTALPDAGFIGTVQFGIVVCDYVAEVTPLPPTDTDDSGVVGGGGGGGTSGGSNSSTTSKTDTTIEEANDTEEQIEDEWKLPFIDVLTSDWFYEDVKNVYLNGIMSGTSETRYAPQNNTTRAMIVQILYTLEGKPDVTFDAALFQDVNETEWYAKAIIWAKANDIAMGLSNDIFAPDQAVTREQLVAFLYRYTVYKGINININININEVSNNFVDRSEISEYAVDNVNWAVENELLFGNTKGELKPKNVATRAEVTAVINRYANQFGLYGAITL